MEGKTAVVTGGGGQNIGQAISHRLAESGANVVIADVDADAGRSVVDGIEDAGGEAAFVETDVTDPDDVGGLVEAAVETYGTLDVLVNSAGRARGVELADIDASTFEWNLRQNLTSAAICTREALPHLRDGGGSVVFISSVNALLGGFSEVAYSSAKAGLHALCRGLTADYAPEGVRFNVVCPGSVIGDASVWDERKPEESGTLEDLADLYPLGRYGKPEDVAEVVHFLASDRADWITGIVLPVDGGISATGNLPGGEWWNSI
ncbi:NAD(P)-dependent oxidoreductase [Halobacteriales archaeon QS_1_68_20]|nr:MAG: NAD(P)-dependent oxidoreductase [Halobacteriales archaeon QS_1_68_20]